LVWAVAAVALGGRQGRAQNTDPRQPVVELYAALHAAMRMGHAAPFRQRFDELAPAIEQAFDLDAILQTSVGLRWSSLEESERQTLATVFRAFTVASYTANFDTDNGDKFEVLPQTRAAEADVIVESRLVPEHGDPVRIDYLMRRGHTGWHIVDVLLDGTISRVAVQRSDFRALLLSGSPEPLIASLKKKVADLSGGAMRL
jgi:phospholipid transport system substrate-binding protein